MIHPFVCRVAALGLIAFSANLGLGSAFAEDVIDKQESAVVSEDTKESVEKVDFDAFRSSVVVWRTQGDRSMPMPGLVLTSHNGRTFILAQRLPADSRRNLPPPTFDVEVDGKKIPLEKNVDRKHLSAVLFTAPGEKLPRPAGQLKRAKLMQGQTVHALGFDTRFGASPSAEKHVETGNVHRVFRTLEGEIASIRIELPTPPANMSVVVDANGDFVGAYLADFRPKRPLLGPTRFFVFHSVDRLLARVREPILQRISFVSKEERVFRIAVFVADPLAQVRRPRLHIAPFTKKDARPPIDGPTGNLKTSIPPLKLKSIAMNDELIAGLSDQKEDGRLAVFVGDLELEEPVIKEFAGFHFQFEHETADGKRNGGFIQTVVPFGKSDR